MQAIGQMREGLNGPDRHSGFLARENNFGCEFEKLESPVM